MMSEDREPWPGAVSIPRRLQVWSGGVYMSAHDEPGQGNPNKPKLHGGLPVDQLFGQPWWIDAIGVDVSHPDSPEYLLFCTTDRRRWAPASVLADRGSIARLADFGLPITVSTISTFADVAELWRIQARKRPPLRVSTKLGHLVIETDEGPEVGHLSPFGWAGDSETVELVGSIPSVLRHARSCGTLEAWIEMANRYTVTPLTRLLLASAFAPSLLRRLGVRTFLFHHWGKSGYGKSAAARLAASVWGHPKNLSLTFNSTQRGLMEAVPAFDGMACVVNELQVASYRNQLSGLVYTLPEEGGRLRSGHQGGAERTQGDYRTIIRTNGEQGILSESAKGTGERNRVLELRANAFDPELAGQLHRELEAPGCPFGVAGPVWIRWVYSAVGGETIDQAAKLARAGGKDRLESLGLHHVVTSQAYDYAVSLMVADALWLHALCPDVPFDVGEAAQGAVDRLALVAPAVFPDPPAPATDTHLAVISDALSGRADVYDMRQADQRERASTAGVTIAALLHPTESEVAWITPPALKRIVKDHGLAISQVTKELVEAGHMLPDVLRRRVGQRQVRVYVLTNKPSSQAQG